MRRIPISLTHEQWTLVLQVLAQQPWQTVNQIILDIQRQAAAASRPTPIDGANPPPPAENDE